MANYTENFDFSLLLYSPLYSSGALLELLPPQSTQQAMLSDPRLSHPRRGRDHPAVYVGWLKHAHFDLKRTFDVSWPILSSSCTHHRARSPEFRIIFRESIGLSPLMDIFISLRWMIEPIREMGFIKNLTTFSIDQPRC